MEAGQARIRALRGAVRTAFPHIRLLSIGAFASADSEPAALPPRVHQLGAVFAALSPHSTFDLQPLALASRGPPAVRVLCRGEGSGIRGVAVRRSSSLAKGATVWDGDKIEVTEKQASASQCLLAFRFAGGGTFQGFRV